MKRPKLNTSDFKLTFDTRSWANETYDGFPVLRWPSGSLCEPATLFFGYSVQYRRGVAVSSLKPEAFAIREWLVFLANRGIRFEKADDFLLRDFREEHKQLIEANKVHPHSVERKISTIYLLYRSLDDLLSIDLNGRRRRRMVAPEAGQKTYPFSTATYDTKDGVTQYVWSGSRLVSPKGTKRTTPDRDEVAHLLAWIRSKPDRLQNKGKEVDLNVYILADRDWMIARTECEGGYRRKEVANLSLRHVWQCLAAENISVPVSALELATCDSDRQALILKELDELNQMNPFVEFWVNGKGNKTRYAPVPVRFVIDLLTVWIWKGRQTLMERAKLKPEVAVYEVFISTETLGALQPGSVGNLIKSAFKGAKVSGSGQRLRAHYCTVTAIRLWEDAMKRNGFNFSQTVYNLVMDRLADAMGHAKADTTVKYYLDLAVSKYFGFSERSKYVVFHGIWNTVADNFSQLSSTDLRGIVKLIETFAKPGTEQLKKVIALALSDTKLNPDPQPTKSTEQEHPAPPEPEAKRSHLHIVFSDTAQDSGSKS